MNKTMKKVLSLVIVMIMVLSSVPMTTFAASNWLCDISGHAYEWKLTTPATCTAKGVETYACKRDGCDATNGTREVALVAHTETTIPAKAPTCDEDGNTEGKVCGVCGYVITACKTLDKKGHTAVPFAAVSATCTTNGTAAGEKCSTCGDILKGGEVVAAAGHNYKLISYDAGSCTESGKEIYECRTCGETKTTVLDAEHNYGTWSIVKAATCKEAGSTERICRSCGAKETKAIDKLAHTEVIVAAKDATCTEPGTSAGKKCSVCGTVTEGCVAIAAKGHTEVVVKGTPAACGKKGTTDASYCSVCNTAIKEQKELAALDHIMVTDTANSKAATCTTEGIKAEKCSREGCTYTVKTTIPASHNFSSYTETKATCTKDGKKSGYCSVCKTTTTETIPATGHKVTNNASWVTTKEATCLKDGEKKANCAVCGEPTVKVIPATGHTEVVYKPEQAATCTAVGYTESKHCSVCKTVTVPAKEIPKSDHTYGEWTVVKSATCAAAGIEKATCTVCKEEKTRTVDRLPHTEKTIDAVAATCTTAGSTAGIECSVCSAKIKEVEAIPALGHDLVKDATVSKEATCTENGWIKAACSRCDYVQDEAIPALGHVEEVMPGTPADCTQSGITDGKKCTTCGEVLVEQATAPALGHDLIADPAKSKPATCTEKGMDFLDCSRCDYTEEKEVPALDHTWGEWEEVTAPTCDTKGEKKRVCSTCNTVEDEEIPSLGGHQTVTSPGYPATCTEPGKTNGTHCEICNTVIELQEDIDPLGHDIEGAEYELTKASVEKEGIHAIYCKVCGQPDETTKTIIPQIDEKSIKLSTAECTYNGKKRTPSVSVKNVDGEDLIEGEDFEIEYPSGRKDVGEYTIIVKFIGNYEGEYDLKFVIAPGKTSKVTATSSQKDYVKISWSKVTGATGYRVYIYKTVDGKTRKRVASVTGTSYNLKKDYAGDGLEVGAEYKVAVVAYTKFEDGTVIHALAGVAKTFQRTPGKPSITSISSSSGKAKLTWSDVEDETAYQVWYSTSKDGTYKKAGTGLTSTTYSKSFTKGKTIYFKVRAYTKVDGEPVYGSFGAVKSVTIK